MAIYVVLYKFTEQGIKTIKESPSRVAQFTNVVEAMGGKVLGTYYTMGEYDLVGIGEFPNDEIAMTFLLRLSQAGTVRTTTLKAFTVEQFAEFVKTLP